MAPTPRAAAHLIAANCAHHHHWTMELLPTEYAQRMGYTTSDFTILAARRKARAEAANDEQEPIHLSYIFFWGFAFSVLVVLGLVWVAAAYETGDAMPWTAERRMTPDETFGVIRNGVTAAAALGVGVTLFFSYRRQQTSERTLNYTAKTQRLAVEAQSLAEERLRIESLDTLRKRYLDIATLLNSATDFNRITALHALESLIISWRQAGDDREASACLGLLLSTMRLSRSEASAAATEFLRTAQSIVERHMQIAAGQLSWGELSFDATRCISKTGLRNWVIDGGDIVASPRNEGPVGASGVTLLAGSVRLSDYLPDSLENDSVNTLERISVQGGRLNIVSTSENPVTAFVKCKFTGGTVVVSSTRPGANRKFSFESSEFSGGVIQISPTKPTSVLFLNCHFTAPPMGGFALKRRADRKFSFVRCTAIDGEGNEVTVDSELDLFRIFFPGSTGREPDA
ncbi:hypothetical protein [Arthrobacter burdickii]|uniref:Uncharacterized protein n=1 Tax=Arthrobacter burdickii TaxID=3035920 RepID=A0ABT8K3B8_9MICC|nr:hypothetical protein [Arthrobacter burdickii]MDN4611934.1 hypothetical protein [Arthrobacter burdickii]